MKRQWMAGAMALVLGASVLTGCDSAQEETEQEGRVLTVAMVDKPTTLDPIYATDVTTQTVLANLNDTLMTQTVGEDGAVEAVGALAKSVESTVNDDGTTTYTFTLRRAYWSDGELVTAQDFVHGWKRLVDPENGSPYGNLLSMVVGYEEAVSTGNPHLLDVTAVDDTTFVVRIASGNDWFLSQVCTAIATQPVREDGDVAVMSCGGYTMDSQEGDTWTLVAFEEYYTKTQGADTLEITFYDSADLAWEAYEEGTADFVSTVPGGVYSQMVAEEAPQGVGSLLGTTYVAINNQDALLSDVLVRQALYDSVDYEALLLDDTYEQAKGLVPVGVREDGDSLFYDRDLTTDQDQVPYAKRQMNAQLALSQSTYPTLETAYTMELLYLSGQEAVAQLLCQQWQVTLGLTVTAVAVTQEEMTQAMAAGTYQLALATLAPQIDDAEPYLNCWTAGHTANVLGYANTAYDMLLSVVAVAEESSGRLGCLHDAQALMLEEYALVPLYCQNTAWALQDGLTGLVRDSRGWFTLATVA